MREPCDVNRRTWSQSAGRLAYPIRPSFEPNVLDTRLPPVVCSWLERRSPMNYQRKASMIVLATLLLAAVSGRSTIARADEGPTFDGPISPPEAQFIQSMQNDLYKRFPHAADAEKAGYVRYTGVD